MKINMIAAVSKNGIIGNNNTMVWNIKKDTDFYTTMVHNQICIYGRKTFEHNIDFAPNRMNIVITRQTLTNNEYTYYTTMDNVFHILSTLHEKYPTKKIFVAGGTDIYNYFLPFSTILYITFIDKEYEGDRTFPDHNYRLVRESKNYISWNEKCLFKLQCFVNTKFKIII